MSDIFLRLIKSIIAPLLFGTLVYGIAGAAAMSRRMGRIGAQGDLYFEWSPRSRCFWDWAR